MKGTYHVYDLLKVEEVIASEGMVLTVHKSEKLWREKQEGRKERRRGKTEVKRGKLTWNGKKLNALQIACSS